MADIVEIYICKPGQKLKEGKLVMTDTIVSKQDAEADSRRRCHKDPTIGRLAYYKINEEGEFRSFYSYNNPIVVGDAPDTSPRPEPGAGINLKEPRKKRLWGKIKNIFGK
jgi:hypothetical protein